MIRVGPAGWSYPDWDGKVYPLAKPAGFHPLAHLARSFACIEINSTFYAMPRAEHAQRWVHEVAERGEFRFVVKLHRLFTHQPEPGASDGGEHAWTSAAREFALGIEPLRRSGKLSALLVQFPVSFLFGKDEVRRLGRVKALFDDVPLVVEMRHASWFAPPALSTLRGLSCSAAYIDLPPAWNHPPQWHAPTGSIGYLRLHGRNEAAWFQRESERDEKYDYLYSSEELRALVAKAERIAEQHADSYVVTNNHFAGKAVANALEIMALFAKAPVPAPAEIVEAFPHLRAFTRIEGQQRLF